MLKRLAQLRNTEVEVFWILPCKKIVKNNFGKALEKDRDGVVGFRRYGGRTFSRKNDLEAYAWVRPEWTGSSGFV